MQTSEESKILGIPNNVLKNIGLAVIYVIVLMSTVVIGYTKAETLLDPEEVQRREFWDLYGQASSLTSTANDLLKAEDYYSKDNLGKWDDLSTEAEDLRGTLSGYSINPKYQNAVAPFDSYLASLIDLGTAAKTLAQTETFTSADETKYKDLSTLVGKSNEKLGTLNGSLQSGFKTDIEDLRISLHSDTITVPQEPAEIVSAIRSDEIKRKAEEEAKTKKAEDEAIKKQREEQAKKAEAERQAQEQEEQRKKEEQQRLAQAKAAQEEARRIQEENLKAQQEAQKRLAAQQEEARKKALEAQKQKPLYQYTNNNALADDLDDDDIVLDSQPQETIETPQPSTGNGNYNGDNYSYGSEYGDNYDSENTPTDTVDENLPANIAYGEFILNLSTGKLHKPGCSSEEQLEDGNKSPIYGPIDLNQYDLCEDCF